jgi:Flp pilus assembly protein TadB
VSKQRRLDRAERARSAELRAAEARAAQQRAGRERQRRDRRRTAWTRMRLWQHGAAFHRRREQWGVLATIAFVALVVVYVATGSVVDVVGAALALLICAPVLFVLFVDRRGS